MNMIWRSLAGVVAFALAPWPAPAFAQVATLDQIRQRGVLNCGVSTGLIGFSDRGTDGRWSGFDVDVCRAVAA
jgi:general L-amino acid transport system substrate-binding protein